MHIGPLGWLAALALLSSHAGAAPAVDAPLALVGGRVLGEDGVLRPRTVHVAAGRIRAVDERPAEPGERAVDVAGRVLVPGAIDSHVHLAFGAPLRELAGGVAAVVDLGAPLSLFDKAPSERASAIGPLRVVFSGPLLTAPGGYPTRGWGANGFGLEVASDKEAARAVAELAAHGARVIKLAIEPAAGPTLSAAALLAATRAAHARGLKVGAHAVGVASVRAALAAGVDFLAHTPLERLPDELARGFCARPGAAVISTLAAFGARGRAIDNLRRMRLSGCIVLYGTDLGNGISEGIQPDELAALAEAGLPPSAILEAATRAPAAYFRLGDLGAIAPGRTASLLALSGDPTRDALALARRTLVVAGGLVVSR